VKLSQIAATLFTLRDYCGSPPELSRTARKLRAIGYQAVQLARVDAVKPEEIVDIMAGEGLTICATHEASNDILTRPEWVVEKLRTLGCSLTAYPYPHGVDFTNASMVKEFVRKLDSAGATLRAAGMTLGYHNHDLEFAKIDGGTILDYIFDHTDARNLVGELDTYWVQCGGGDCVSWCRRLSGRLPFIHLKDYALDKDGKPNYCEIGRGTLPFREIIDEAERSGCRWFIVEQDTCPGDPFDSLAISFDFMKANLVS
jgi:sugar phosphate isomerase/epimerase